MGASPYPTPYFKGKEMNLYKAYYEKLRGTGFGINTKQEDIVYIVADKYSEAHKICEDKNYEVTSIRKIEGDVLIKGEEDG